jgi:hypothetical protein
MILKGGVKTRHLKNVQIGRLYGFESKSSKSCGIYVEKVIKLGWFLTEKNVSILVLKKVFFI